MKKIILCLIVFAGSAFAEMDKTQMDLFKKESRSMRDAIDEVMNANVQGRGLAETANATYLEGYGAVFTLEASLEPTRSPFSSPKTPAEIRSIVNQRRKAIETKLQELLKQRAGSLQSVASTDSVTIVLYLFNANAADVPDLPSQLIFTTKKQDPSQVRVSPF
jgi:hypothetical protein